MSQPLTRLDLNALVALGCDCELCTLTKGTALHIRPKCHRHKPVNATYNKHLGTITLACASCGSTVQTISVAEI